MSIDRIAKLLQMAERAKTPHEAAAFFGKAQAIASAHEISLAQARLHTDAAQRVAPVQKRLTVGRKRQQANRHYLRLLVGLGRANGCEVGLYNDNTAAVLFGLPSDIATVETMFAVIAPQMIRRGEDFLATDAWRAEGVSKQRARASFYLGFTETLRARLAEAARQAKRDAVAEEVSHFHDDGDGAAPPEPGRTGVELALLAKEEEVKRFAAAHVNGTWRGGRETGPVSGSSYLAGDRAATQVDLRDKPAVGGPRRAVAGGRRGG